MAMVLTRRREVAVSVRQVKAVAPIVTLYNPRAFVSFGVLFGVCRFLYLRKSETTAHIRREIITYSNRSVSWPRCP